MTILNVPVRPNGVVINPGVRGYGIQFSDSSGNIVKIAIVFNVVIPYFEMLRYLGLCIFALSLDSEVSAQSGNNTEVLVQLLYVLLCEDVLASHEKVEEATGSADLVVYINEEVERQTTIRLIDRKGIGGKDILFVNDEAIFANGINWFLELTKIKVGGKKAELSFSMVRTTPLMQKIIVDSYQTCFRKNRAGKWVLKK